MFELLKCNEFEIANYFTPDIFSFVIAVSMDNGTTMGIVSSFIPNFPSWFSSTGMLAFYNSLPLVCFLFSNVGLRHDHTQP